MQQAAITSEVEAAAAAVEAELDAQEWNMQEIERIQEEQACTDINTAQPHASRLLYSCLAHCLDLMLSMTHTQSRMSRAMCVKQYKCVGFGL